MAAAAAAAAAAVQEEVMYLLLLFYLSFSTSSSLKPNLFPEKPLCGNWVYYTYFIYEEGEGKKKRKELLSSDFFLSPFLPLIFSLFITNYLFIFPLSPSPLFIYFTLE